MADRTTSAITETADREFEIVLDNKRLFSLLFIVFVLLGVFFAMGYLMGRNTLPVDTVAGRTGSTPAAGANRPPVTEPVEDPAPAARQPQAETTATVTPAAEPPAAPVSAARQPAPTESAPPSMTVADPQPGQTFLQVAAITKAEAELLVEVLVKKGFKAVLAPAPGPKENVFRVLVGPVKDAEDLTALRGQLEQSGFKPIPRRY